MSPSTKQHFINAVGLSLASLVLAKDSTEEEWKTAVSNLYAKSNRAINELNTRTIVDDVEDDEL